jgi:acetylornithine deacetylase/succinyl-diaminopimelate desuccinylase-like protein
VAGAGSTIGPSSRRSAWTFSASSTSLSSPEQFLEDSRERGLRELEEFLRIPSISSQPDHDRDVHRAAEHLAAQYSRIGLEHAEVIETSGHPVVYADWLKAPGEPTVLLYGHYDVQPVDPLDLWTTPPFEPRQQNGLLFGRGSSDDKGQIAVHWQAIEAWLRSTGTLPLNLKVIAEGDEEIGSPPFEDFVRIKREQLRTDFCVVSDTVMAAKGLPAITYALRGLVYFELRVETANTDLHSGAFGGVAPNPAQVLAQILTMLKDSSGRILVPGFYDRVRPLSDEERRQFARMPFDENETKRNYALEALDGEPGFTPTERNWARPTLEVNGISGGYEGAGAKTIIPAWASAKISCRLVPEQDPADIARAIGNYLERIRPGTARVSLKEVSGRVAPWITQTDHPLIQAGQRALARVYGREPVLTRSGGSIGAVDTMGRLLNAPCLLVGFVLPDCLAHAPNERLDLDSFYAGRRAALHLWEEIAAIDPTAPNVAKSRRDASSR